MSLLIKLAIPLAVIALLVAVSMLWAYRRQRKREEAVRLRGPDSTIRPERRPEQKTDRWNISG